MKYNYAFVGVVTNKTMMFVSRLSSGLIIDFKYLQTRLVGDNTNKGIGSGLIIDFKYLQTRLVGDNTNKGIEEVASFLAMTVVSKR